MQKSNQRYRLALRVRHLVREKVDDLTLAIILAGTAGKGEIGRFFGEGVVAADAIFLCFCENKRLSLVRKGLSIAERIVLLCLDKELIGEI